MIQSYRAVFEASTKDSGEALALYQPNSCSKYVSNQGSLEHQVWIPLYPVSEKLCGQEKDWLHYRELSLQPDVPRGR